MLICLLYFLSTSTLHHSHRKTLFPLAKVPYCVHFLSSCPYCTRFFFVYLLDVHVGIHPIHETHLCGEMQIYLFRIWFGPFFGMSDRRTTVDIYIFSLVLYCFYSRNINNQKCKHFIHLWQLFRFVVHWNACTKARILKNHQKNTSLDKIVWVSACQIIIRFVLYSDFFPCSGSILTCW